MTGRAGLSLRDGFDLSGADVQDLWVRYVALGGCEPAARLAEFIDTDADGSPREHDIIAQALNEAFLDKGMTEFPVATVLPPAY